MSGTLFWFVEADYERDLYVAARVKNAVRPVGDVDAFCGVSGITTRERAGQTKKN